MAVSVRPRDLVGNRLTARIASAKIDEVSIDSEDVRVFDVIARTRTLSAAARELGKTPSAVTRSLDRLESTLDARLFARNTRALRLTDEGERFATHAARLLAEYEAAEQAVRTRRDDLRGRLRVTASATFASLHLAPIFAELLERHPQLELDLLLTDDYVDLVEQGVDLAIRIQRTAIGGPLIARRLAPDRRILCASPEYLARAGTPRTPADLVNHRCIVLERDPTWTFLSSRGKRTTVRVPATVRTSLGAFALQAVCAGLGLARASEWHAATALASGKVVRVLPEHDLDDAGHILAVYPTRRRIPARTRALLDLLTTRFTSPTWWRRQDSPP